MEGYKKASILDGFDIPEITHETIEKQLFKVAKTHIATQKRSVDNLPVSERIERIREIIYGKLGRYIGFVRVLYGNENLEKYIDTAITVGEISFDTETNNSVDPLTCSIMGLCFYLPNTFPVYVPMNHINPDNGELLPNQVTVECARNCLKRLSESGTKIVYHNAKFDIRVCYNYLGLYPSYYWDTMIASQLLDENEQAKLKVQFNIHIDPTMGIYDIEGIFTGIGYAKVPPELFALYAAIDPYDTHILYKWQKELFERDGMERLYKLYREIELPVIRVSAEMEDRGVCIDLDFVQKMTDKHTKNRQRAEEKLNEILEEHKQKIRYYQQIGKLDNPINYESAQQLGLIIYDILKIPPAEDCGKSTDKNVLKLLKHPFTEALLDYKHYNGLLTKFLIPLPNHVSKKDGKIHCSLNQMGVEDNNVRTGRFSSTKPNL